VATGVEGPAVAFVVALKGRGFSRAARHKPNFEGYGLQPVHQTQPTPKHTNADSRVRVPYSRGSLPLCKIKLSALRPNLHPYQS
jgi:hypothetical protein